MFIVIFGRAACPYCDRAKDIAQQLNQKNDDIQFRYIDIGKEGISKADLSKTVGHTVETVPQIFIDEKHIGGCTEFEAYAKDNLDLYA